MPTTNSSSQQQTDTNNNSNNKITNGRPEAVVVVPLVAPAAVVGATMLLASQTSQAAAAAAAAAAATVVTTAATIMPASPRAPQTASSLISAIKQHGAEAPQAPLISATNINNNNSNNTNNNNTNNVNNNSISMSKQAQTEHQQQVAAQTEERQHSTKIRSNEELVRLIKDLSFDRTSLSNEELTRLVKANQVSIYKLESFLGKDNAARCVEVRRNFYRLELAELDKIDQLGVRDRAQALTCGRYEDLDYERVNGACCENVIGHVKVPVGLAGPLVLDNEEIFVPLATTEGCLVASTCRGLSALRKSGGVTSRVRRDFMTRAPIIRFKDSRLIDALDNVERAIAWLNDKSNKEKMRNAFNLTSSHGKFLNYTMYPVNREIHIRFEAQTGDAMGMNMCSKGVESALKEMQRAFPTMEIVTLSGNMCTDKKAAGINWINGRGKAVECNAELPAHVVQQVFKVTVDQLVDRWKSKVMIGSALAASIGGFNSQAANILTAIFIATGQDPAQNVTSSNCMLILEKDSKGSLVVCCTMPSIECGTVGGGTILNDQSRYLQMMGIKGSTPKTIRQKQQRPNQQQSILTNGGNGETSRITTGANKCSAAQATSASSSSSNISCNLKQDNTGQLQICAPKQLVQMQPFINHTNEFTNARKLARIICATVMAAELSLLAALTEGTLVKSHMRHNRSSTNVTLNNLSPFGGGQLSAATSSCFGPIANMNNTTVFGTNQNSFFNNYANNHCDDSSIIVNTSGSGHTLMPDLPDADESVHINNNNINCNQLTSGYLVAESPALGGCGGVAHDGGGGGGGLC